MDTFYSQLVSRNSRNLLVFPNDPLEAYESAGYPDLTNYFNPQGYFDNVYSFEKGEDFTKRHPGLSSFGKLEHFSKKIYGIKRVVTDEHDFIENVYLHRISIARAYDLRAALNAEVMLPKRIPLVVSVHDVNIQRVSRLYNFSADLYIAISEAVKRFLLSFGVDERKIIIIPNRVDMEKFRPDPVLDIDLLLNSYLSKHVHPKTEKLILFVGRKVHQKNLETLIKALSFLNNGPGPFYSLIAAGVGDDSSYVDIAKRYNVEEYIRFEQSINNNDLPAFFSKCDVFCVMSRWEGFGIVFIEAMACGTKVVTSKIAPMTEFIRHDRNGFLVEHYEDPRSVALMIEHAVKTDLDKNKIRESVRHFSSDSVNAQEVRMYENLTRKFRFSDNDSRVS